MKCCFQSWEKTDHYVSRDGWTMKEVGLNHRITYSASKQHHAIQHVKPLMDQNITLTPLCHCHLVIKIWSFKFCGTKKSYFSTKSARKGKIHEPCKVALYLLHTKLGVLFLNPVLHVWPLTGVCEKTLRPFKSLTIGCFISDYGFTSVLTLTFLLLSAGNSSLTVKSTPVSLACNVHRSCCFCFPFFISVQLIIQMVTMVLCFSKYLWIKLITLHTK